MLQLLYKTREQWLKDVQNVAKLRTYVKFKDEYKLENYLSINLSRQERSHLAQFRCGVLPLRIETGRFVGQTVSERVCQMCSTGAVESEIHFLLQCTFYLNERTVLIDALGTKYPNFSTITQDEQINIFMNHEPRLAARFILSAFNKRKSKLHVKQ